jgi:hypothetical protein
MRVRLVPFPLRVVGRLGFELLNSSMGEMLPAAGYSGHIPVQVTARAAPS